MNFFGKKNIPLELFALALGILLVAVPVVRILNGRAAGGQKKADEQETERVIGNGKSDDLFYVEYEKHICIISYQGYESDISIPSKIGGKPVTRIGGENPSSNAFPYIKSVKIPDTVTELGRTAFKGSEFLESVTLSKNLKEIADEAFSGCGALKDVLIPKGVETIGDHAFSGCTELAEVTIPDGVISIGYGAFSNCTSLTELTLPDSVVSIEKEAFCNCSNLERLHIPESVTEIGRLAFAWNAWLNGIADEFVVVGDGVLIDYTGNEESIVIPDNVSVIGCAFVDNEVVKSITIGDHVKKLLPGCFSDCKYLEEISIGDGITEIPENAMSGLGYLTRVELGENVAEIGNKAFYECDNLCQMVLPENLERIGDEAFGMCWALQEIYIPYSVTAIGSNAFSGTPWLTNQEKEFVVAGSGILLRYRGTASEVRIPDGIRVIGYSAFSGNSNIEKVELSKTVEEISGGAFSDCDGLVSIKFQDSVKVIGAYAFKDCDSLESIVIPDSVETLERGIFSECSNLLDVTLPAREEITLCMKSLYKRGEDGWDYRLHIPEAVKCINVIDGNAEADVKLPSNMFNSEYGQEDKIIVCGASGSYAEEFAEKWNLRFVSEEVQEGKAEDAEDAEDAPASTGSISEEGFDTPEAVVTAFVERVQEQDVEKLLSGFAIETAAAHFQLEKEVDQMKSYIPETLHVPEASDYANQLNAMCERRKIIKALRMQYLGRIGSVLADDDTSGMILKDYNGDVQKLMGDCFPVSWDELADEIVLKGFFDLQKLSAHSLERYSKIIETTIPRYEELYGGDVQPVAAWLVMDGEDYLLSMDVIQYDGQWYGLNLGGCYSYFVSTTDSGGLATFEQIREKNDGLELDFEDSLYTVS